MSPGDQLDALIAEKVFGLKRVSMPIEDGYFAFVWEPGAIFILPKYSTNITDAWGVVEKMKSRCFIGSVDLMPKGYRVLLHKIDDFGETIGDQKGIFTGYESESAPHAICLAALKAVGELK